MITKLNILKTYVIMLALSMCSFFCLTGCDNSDDVQADNYGYDIYYKSEDGAGLVAAKYSSDSTGKTVLAKEFIAKMKEVGEKAEYKSLFENDLNVYKVEMKNTTLNVYFNASYNNLTNTSEMLLRAGLVKTLTQIEGVKYIQLYVDGAPAQYSDGTAIGLLDAGDFIDDSAAGMDSILWEKVEFYYANERGDKLVKYEEEIAYSKNNALERLVIEKLIKGPTDKSMQATVPATIKLLDISVNERVCYVNLDSTFLSAMVNVSAELPVYSIVNTLCSLPGIDSVKFLIDGDANKVYRETIKLEQNFFYNYEMVESTKTD